MGRFKRLTEFYNIVIINERVLKRIRVVVKLFVFKCLFSRGNPGDLGENQFLFLKMFD